MVKKRTRRIVGNILIFGGAGIIVASHIPLLITQELNMVVPHAIIQISAAGAMLLGGLWGMR